MENGKFNDQELELLKGEIRNVIKDHAMDLVINGLAKLIIDHISTFGRKVNENASDQPAEIEQTVMADGVAIPVESINKKDEIISAINATFVDPVKWAEPTSAEFPDEAEEIIEDSDVCDEMTNVVVESDEIIEETAVDEDMSVEVQDATPEDVEASVKDSLEEQPAVEISNERLVGVVFGCESLRVRQKPDCGPNSPIVGVLKASDKVFVGDECSTDFYSIEAESGMTGFCLRKFIKLI